MTAESEYPNTTKADILFEEVSKYAKENEHFDRKKFDDMQILYVVFSSMEAYLQQKVTSISDERRDELLDEYGFQVPYDRSNEFYDKKRMKHWKNGWEAFKQQLIK